VEIIGLLLSYILVMWCATLPYSMVRGGSSSLLVISWREALILVGESILRKFVGFSPRGFSQGKYCVFCGCYSFNDPLYAIIGLMVKIKITLI
jgi:hypothetical protein